MKRAFAAVSLVLLMAFVSGCAAVSQNDGIYRATAQGRNGPISLEVEIGRDRRINDICVISHQETPEIGGVALQSLCSAIVQQQSLDVDSISGATVTTHAVLKAVSHALAIAGLEPDDYYPSSAPESTDQIDETLETDVIVIGSGAAGFSAAVTACENGANVIMLEKMSILGGNTLRSSGTMNAVDPARQKPYGIDDSVELFFNQTYQTGDRQADPELTRVMVEGAYDARIWLEQYGAQWQSRAYQAIGALWPRSVSPAKTNTAADIFINNLREPLESSGGMILSETRAAELLMDGGRVTGVIAFNDHSHKRYIIHAEKGVVLATGGYAANTEMLLRFSNAGIPLSTSNHPGATGDGLLLAQSVGAALVDMEYVQIHPHGNPRTGELVSLKDVSELIYVNTAGDRFVDESLSWSQLSHAEMQQPNCSAYALFDRKLAEKSPKLDSMLSKGDVYAADTIEELSLLMGIEPQKLRGTLNAYNQCIYAGKTDAFGKLDAKPLDTPPYYAMLIVPTFHYTMGGVKIDSSARVVSVTGVPIEGLFAAGEVTGGVHGANRVGGNGLVDAAVFGRIAGKSATTPTAEENK